MRQKCGSLVSPDGWLVVLYQAIQCCSKKFRFSETKVSKFYFQVVFLFYYSSQTLVLEIKLVDFSETALQNATT